MKMIIISKNQDAWFADFVGDSTMFEAFGTTLIPTAFTANAEKATVLEAIKKLNPGYEVIASL